MTSDTNKVTRGKREDTFTKSSRTNLVMIANTHLAVDGVVTTAVPHLLLIDDVHLAVDGVVATAVPHLLLIDDVHR